MRKIKVAIWRFFCLLLPFLFSSGMMAQQMRFRSIMTSDGLPQSSVECFAQDSAGFMWIGTQDGLARFDGHEMIVYRHDDDNPYSLSDNFITNLLVDQSGDLWVGTRNGVNYYDERTDRFIKFLPDLDLLHQKNLALRNWPDGRVACLIYGQVYLLDKQLYQKPWNALKALPETHFAALRGTLCLNHMGSELYSVAGRRLYRWDADSHLVAVLPAPWPNIVLSEAFMTAGSARIWIIANGLYALHPDGQRLEDIRFDGAEDVRYLTGVLEIGDELWVSTDRGLFILDADHPQEVLRHEQHRTDDAFSLNYDHLHGLFLDRQHQVWIGTANNGINIGNPRWEQWHYLQEDRHVKPPPNPLVWCSVQTPEGEVWMGTAEGIRPVMPPRGSAASTRPIPNALAGITSVRDMLFDRNGMLWIASSRTGLYRYDPERDLLTNDGMPSSTEMVSLCADSQGGLWAASYNGLFHKPPQGEAFVSMVPEFNISSYILSVSSDDRYVHVCHSNGYARVEVGGLQPSVRRVNASPRDSTKLPFSICSQAVLIDDRIYVGMYDRGVAVLDLGLNILRILDESDGLAGHVVETMLADQQGRLWIGTNQGLSVYVPENGQIRSFTESNGLRSGEFSLDGGRMDHTGLLYLGGLEGLLAFHPDSVLQALPAPAHRIQLSSLVTNYRDYRQLGEVGEVGEPDDAPSGSGHNKSFPLPLRSIRTLEIQPSEKVITFNFTANDFEDGPRLRYRFRMLGFEDEWVEVSPARRIATYSHLPAGNYVFEAEAHYPDGRPAALPLRLALLVMPPFYETWWFRFSAIGLLILLVASAVRFVTYRKYRNRIRAMETHAQIQRERQRISRDLHDHIGSQITYMISSLDHLSYQSSKTGASGQQVALDGLGNFARGTMQQLREAIWVINKDAVSLSEFRLKLEEYCQKIFEYQHETTWAVELNEPIERTLDPGVVLHLFRIFQEAVNNALKHAQATEVRIVLNSDDILAMEISDNGHGFDDQSVKPGHFGLENIRQRAAEMGAEVHWLRNETGGMTVRLTWINPPPRA